MNEETKNRLRTRLSDLVDAITEQPQTIDDWELLVLNLRERCAQAALDEIGQELANSVPPEVAPPSERESPPDTASCSCKLACPQCGKSAWYKGDRLRQIVTMAGAITVRQRCGVVITAARAVRADSVPLM